MPWITAVVVGDRFDAVDDWIAARAQADDIVITGDIPLAARCLQRGARVLSPKGRILTDANIGDALASRELAAQLRELGIATGGPAPFKPRDRSRFLQRLDAIIQAIGHSRRGAS